MFVLRPLLWMPFIASQTTGKELNNNISHFHYGAPSKTCSTVTWYHSRQAEASMGFKSVSHVRACVWEISFYVLECHRVQYYDDWEAITSIRFVKVKHVFPGEANVPLRFTEGNDISPFWQGVLKCELGIGAETKHTSGVQQLKS